MASPQTIQSNWLRLQAKDGDEVTLTSKCPSCLAELSVTFTFTMAEGVRIQMPEPPTISHDCPVED